MANIEEKILDGPRVHYCDEDDNNDIRVEENDDSYDQDTPSVHRDTSVFMRPDEEMERLERLSHVRWLTGSTNTGPKGVIEDYRKRNSAKGKANENDDLEAEIQELLNDDSILKEFISKRMDSQLSFGTVQHLQTGGQLLEAVDKENENVLVIVHIYTKFSKPCKRLNQCLNDLANDLKQIKFVTIDAGATPLSDNFKMNGVPALLAYKGGNLVKSLVQIDDWLDKDFESQQVKELLKDNGLSL